MENSRKSCHGFRLTSLQSTGGDLNSDSLTDNVGKRNQPRKKNRISRSLVYSGSTPEGTRFICTNNRTNNNHQTAQGRRRLTDESTSKSIPEQQVQHRVLQGPQTSLSKEEATAPRPPPQIKVQPLQLHTGTKILLSGETLVIMLFFRAASCCRSRNEEGNDVDLLKQ